MADDPRFNLYAKWGQLVRGDIAATALFTLPRGAIPVAVLVHTDVAAAGATINIGTAANNILYVAAGNVAAVGTSFLTLLDNAILTVARTEIVGLIGGAPVAGGPFDVTMLWITTTSTRVL